MSKKHLLLGDEALALGALHAGLSGAYAYPGTPSTEILEYIQGAPLAKERNIHSRWSSNEKTAMEEALGMSFCGKRAIVSMKHVGMNVAADAFVNSGMTGANGGVIVIAADDPSMHSSQNEQDSRFYGDFAFIPVLEPSSQQECYDMASYAFDLSEKYNIPVLARMVTRLSHSRAVVDTKEEARVQNELHYPKAENERQWVLMPANSKKRYVSLIEDYCKLAEESEKSPFNSYTDGKDKRFGVIVSGLAYNYYKEIFPGESPFPVVKVSQYPLPKKLIAKLADECEAIVVIEEGQPFIESKMRGLLDRGVRVYGKYTGQFPRTGELTPDSVKTGMSELAPEVSELAAREIKSESKVTVPRPPALCQGCGHRDVYHALNDVLKEYESPKVFGDIGCYTLGYLSPFNAIDTCVDMGASITMAKGASDAGQHPSVAIIGDSTFTHSGMTGLLDAINENTPMLVIISDNLTTGMTGGQDSQGTGKLEEICLGLGAHPEHVRTIDSLPKNHDDMMNLFREEINYKGLSVVISRRECIQTARRHASAKKKA
ncbi:MAG: thiamine pyrophosphate-dependent enzyme [Prevotella sp.]|nr:thiamine pyrophosphate-dependent enzyme [Bacteroides sp.]MCM1367141.1 thiamine pyrophosphate-dependent enzyme [Prevotella sp.]MCM1436537.1 thiamine pyrophosphate-dependent enzyme [Prevotella sp.]